MAHILHRRQEDVTPQELDRKPLRGEGKFKIFQGKADFMTQLENIERAGRTCYRSLKGPITIGSAEKFVRMILRRGHESVIEHSIITVLFTNISRGFTHEMVRHRLCAFSQESTRFVDYAEGKLDMEAAELRFVLPPHRNKDESVEIEIDGVKLPFKFLPYAIDMYEKTYKGLRRAGWSTEDARQFLPIGLVASIVVSTNFREWRHIMAMRTQKLAHWEIRYVMCDLLLYLKTMIPVIFEDFTNTDSDGNLLLDQNGYMYFEKVDQG